MNLSLYIARRYLVSKKSHNAINIISLVSVCGIVVATVAMVCLLSVFNGFEDLTTTLFSAFDPELKITTVEGKVFNPDTPALQRLKALDEVALCSETLQENGLVRYGERQEITAVKGVEDSYRDLTMIDSVITDGTFVLNQGDTNFSVLGIGLAASLGVNAAFVHPLEIYMPKRNETVNMTNPSASFRVEYALAGGVYHINQAVYDERFMLVSIDLLRSMLDYKNEVSALEIKLKPDASVSSVKKKMTAILGDGFKVNDRYEQQEATFKMVQIEKWVTFLLLCFILVMALFNVLGSLAILMIEKEEDVEKLRGLGADNKLINRIFIYEGRLISVAGATVGVVIGLILCFIQQYFGLIRLGRSAGEFIVDAYPVKVEWTDIVLVFVSVTVMGCLAVMYPVHYIAKKRLATTCFAALMAVLTCTATVSCGGGSGAQKSDEIKEIAVTIEPLRYFAEKIAGNDYRFFSVVPPGQGPETYDPTPREMVRVGKAVAFMHIGRLPIEKAIATAMRQNNSEITIADVSEQFDNQFVDCHAHAENLSNLSNPSTACDKHHNDPHIWTSLTGARIIADNFYKTFSALNASRKDFYHSNYQSFIKELDALSDTIHALMDTLSCRSFVIYHPALTYLAKEFDFRQLSIEDDGKEPSPASMKQLIEHSREAGVRVVFVQKEFDAKYAEQIAISTGAKLISINTLDYQWYNEILFIVKNLTKNGQTD